MWVVGLVVGLPEVVAVPLGQVLDAGGHEPKLERQTHVEQPAQQLEAAVRLIVLKPQTHLVLANHYAGEPHASALTRLPPASRNGLITEISTRTNFILMHNKSPFAPNERVPTMLALSLSLAHPQPPESLGDLSGTYFVWFSFLPTLHGASGTLLYYSPS